MIVHARSVLYCVKAEIIIVVLKRGPDTGVVCKKLLIKSKKKEKAEKGKRKKEKERGEEER
jgi:hypothetical protein